MSLLPVTDRDLADMKMGDALLWAADADGYLTDIKKLERVAKARRYHPGWVRHVYEQHWEQVVGRTKSYQTVERRKRRNAALYGDW
jgi:hypothetical protein